MFGHNGQHHDGASLPEPDEHGVQDAAQTTDSAGAYLDDVSPTVTAPVTPAAAADDSQITDDAGLGADTTAVADTPASAPVAPTPAEPATPAAAVPAASTTDTDKLLDIKQQALQQLTPLVGHLEQTPEEKFRTTMMMIQASDNQELVPAAYEAAGQIANEKVRAQALLDIVNEINYFTHNTEA